MNISKRRKRGAILPYGEIVLVYYVLYSLVVLVTFQRATFEKGHSKEHLTEHGGLLVKVWDL